MSNDGVVAVERALSVLDCFKPGSDKLTLAQLAQRLPLHKTTIFRLLNSLARCGYVVRHSDGKYTLGPRVLYLGRVYEKSFNLADTVTPILTRLSEQTGESVSYYIENGDDGSRLCLFRHQPHEGLHRQILAGTVMPPDDSATGRIFNIWARGGDRGNEALPFFSCGIRDPYTSSWSTPVIGHDDQFAGALTLAGLSERLQSADAGRYTAALMAAADELSARLGATKDIRDAVYG